MKFEEALQVVNLENFLVGVLLPLLPPEQHEQVKTSLSMVLDQWAESTIHSARLEEKMDAILLKQKLNGDALLAIAELWGGIRSLAKLAMTEEAFQSFDAGGFELVKKAYELTPSQEKNKKNSTAPEM